MVIVGGDGNQAPESQFLRQKVVNLGIEDKVLFAGRVDQKYLPPYYSSADVLVMASHYESFGLVGLEALACGRPVVSTPVGAMESLIQQSRAGHVVGDTLPRSLARGIQSIITHSKLPRLMRFANPSSNTVGPMLQQRYSRNMRQPYATSLMKMTVCCLRKHRADDRNLSSEGHDKIYFEIIVFYKKQNSTPAAAASLIEKDTPACRNYKRC